MNYLEQGTQTTSRKTFDNTDANTHLVIIDNVLFFNGHGWDSNWLDQFVWFKNANRSTTWYIYLRIELQYQKRYKMRTTQNFSDV